MHEYRLIRNQRRGLRSTEVSYPLVKGVHFSFLPKTGNNIVQAEVKTPKSYQTRAKLNGGDSMEQSRAEQTRVGGADLNTAELHHLKATT